MVSNPIGSSFADCEINMKIVAIIQARMHSSRLPGKVLLPVLGKPLLQHMIERLHGCYTLSDIVVATTKTSPEIVELCQALDVGYWIGSEDDVLGRVLEAADFFDADIIVELTGDCPLQDPAMVDKVVSDFLLGGADFVSNNLHYTAPRGFDVRVFSTASLAWVNRLTDDPADHEHVSLYMWENPRLFTTRNVRTELDDKVKDYRLTVDTQEDFELVKAIFTELYPHKERFNLSDILDLLERSPELVQINQHIRQKAVR